MGSLKGTVTMSRQGRGKFPIQRFVGIGGTATSSLFYLLITWTTIDGSDKGFVARGARQSLCLAKVDEFAVDLPFVLLLVVLILFLDELIEDDDSSLREPWLAIASLLDLWQETNVPTAESLCRFSITGCPLTNGTGRSGAVGKMLSIQNGLDDGVATIGLLQSGFASFQHPLAHVWTQTTLFRRFGQSDQLSFSHELLEVRIGQIYKPLILGQQCGRGLSLIQNGATPAIPYDRSPGLNQDDMRAADAREGILHKCYRTGAGCFFIAEDMYPLWLGKRSSVDIDVELLSNQQRVDIIASGFLHSFE
jgi:hypothetical protein